MVSMSRTALLGAAVAALARGSSASNVTVPTAPVLDFDNMPYVEDVCSDEGQGILKEYLRSIAEVAQNAPPQNGGSNSTNSTGTGTGRNNTFFGELPFGNGDGWAPIEDVDEYVKEQLALIIGDACDRACPEGHFGVFGQLNTACPMDCTPPDMSAEDAEYFGLKACKDDQVPYGDACRSEECEFVVSTLMDTSNECKGELIRYMGDASLFSSVQQLASLCVPYDCKKSSAREWFTSFLYACEPDCAPKFVRKLDLDLDLDLEKCEEEGPYDRRDKANCYENEACLDFMFFADHRAANCAAEKLGEEVEQMVEMAWDNCGAEDLEDEDFDPSECEEDDPEEEPDFSLPDPKDWPKDMPDLSKKERKACDEIFPELEAAYNQACPGALDDDVDTDECPYTGCFFFVAETLNSVEAVTCVAHATDSTPRELAKDMLKVASKCAPATPNEEEDSQKALERHCEKSGFKKDECKAESCCEWGNGQCWAGDCDDDEEHEEGEEGEEPEEPAFEFPKLKKKQKKACKEVAAQVAQDLADACAGADLLSDEGPDQKACSSTPDCAEFLAELAQNEDAIFCTAHASDIPPSEIIEQLVEGIEYCAYADVEPVKCKKQKSKKKCNAHDACKWDKKKDKCKDDEKEIEQENDEGEEGEEPEEPVYEFPELKKKQKKACKEVAAQVVQDAADACGGADLSNLELPDQACSSTPDCAEMLSSLSQNEDAIICTAYANDIPLRTMREALEYGIGYCAYRYADVKPVKCKKQKSKKKCNAHDACKWDKKKDKCKDD